VTVAGVTVSPGDLVIADEVGVCFVPFARAAEIIEIVEAHAKDEAARQALLDSGRPLAELAKPRR
jgi:4-hydroxy-4-methyl-2-oxoglutarate aldolase